MLYKTNKKTRSYLFPLTERCFVIAQTSLVSVLVSPVQPAEGVAPQRVRGAEESAPLLSSGFLLWNKLWGRVSVERTNALKYFLL